MLPFAPQASPTAGDAAAARASPPVRLASPDFSDHTQYPARTGGSIAGPSGLPCARHPGPVRVADRVGPDGICKFYARGSCHFGAQCKAPHSLAAVAVAASSSSSTTPPPLSSPSPVSPRMPPLEAETATATATVATTSPSVGSKRPRDSVDVKHTAQKQQQPVDPLNPRDLGAWIAEAVDRDTEGGTPNEVAQRVLHRMKTDPAAVALTTSYTQNMTEQTKQVAMTIVAVTVEQAAFDSHQKRKRVKTSDDDPRAACLARILALQKERDAAKLALDMTHEICAKLRAELKTRDTSPPVVAWQQTLSGNVHQLTHDQFVGLQADLKTVTGLIQAENFRRLCNFMRACKYCSAGTAVILFLPCGHVCACAACEPTANVCAMCSSSVATKLKPLPPASSSSSASVSS